MAESLGFSFGVSRLNRRPELDRFEGFEDFVESPDDEVQDVEEAAVTVGDVAEEFGEPEIGFLLEHGSAFDNSSEEVYVGESSIYAAESSLDIAGETSYTRAAAESVVGGALMGGSIGYGIAVDPTWLDIVGVSGLSGGGALFLSSGVERYNTVKENREHLRHKEGSGRTLFYECSGGREDYRISVVDSSDFSDIYRDAADSDQWDVCPPPGPELEVRFTSKI